MKQNEKQSKRILLLLVLWSSSALWCLLCVFLSSQTGEDTGELSTRLAVWVCKLLGLVDGEITSVNLALRTAAHVVCFFELSLLFSLSSAYTWSKQKLAFLFPLLPCGAFAFLDEIRKGFIAGRHCSISEAFLNLLGCLGGVAVAFGIWWIVQRRKK